MGVRRDGQRGEHGEVRADVAQAGRDADEDREADGVRERRVRVQRRERAHRGYIERPGQPERHPVVLRHVDRDGGGDQRGADGDREAEELDARADGARALAGLEVYGEEVCGEG